MEPTDATAWSDSEETLPGRFQLVVGLGNPGQRYARNRHNAGFMVLDQLARRLETRFEHREKWEAELARTPTMALLKPLTWMNRSGGAVAPYARYFHIPPSDILVVYDDVALPFGSLRLREKGSAGGHNGLQSILDHFSHASIPRLRIGIGDGKADSLTGHVLGDFTESEWRMVPEVFERAVDAILRAHQYGLPDAMNRYN